MDFFKPFTNALMGGLEAIKSAKDSLFSFTRSALESFKEALPQNMHKPFAAFADTIFGKYGKKAEKDEEQTPILSVVNMMQTDPEADKEGESDHEEKDHPSTPDHKDETPEEHAAHDEHSPEHKHEHPPLTAKDIETLNWLRQNGYDPEAMKAKLPPSRRIKLGSRAYEVPASGKLDPVAQRLIEQYDPALEEPPHQQFMRIGESHVRPTFGKLILRAEELMNQQVKTKDGHRIRLVVTCGYRDWETQKKEWLRVNRNEALVAKPGESFHQTGLAADVYMLLEGAGPNGEDIKLSYSPKDGDVKSMLDEMGIKKWNPDLIKQIRSYQEIMLKVMGQVGLVCYWHEGWHYEFANSFWRQGMAHVPSMQGKLKKVPKARGKVSRPRELPAQYRRRETPSVDGR